MLKPTFFFGGAENDLSEPQNMLPQNMLSRIASTSVRVCNSEFAAFCCFDTSAYQMGAKSLRPSQIRATEGKVPRLSPASHMAHVVRSVHAAGLQHAIVGGHGGLVVLFYATNLRLGEGRGFCKHPFALLAKDRSGAPIVGVVWVVHFGDLRKPVWVKHEQGWDFNTMFLSYLSARAEAHEILATSVFYKSLVGAA
ncbi:MAG: hypothetical protein CL450_06625 [Acidimicrobiaceae bacterium]|nr:hypothetical protein [Acidimicrobiaceae bacterium]